MANEVGMTFYSALLLEMGEFRVGLERGCRDGTPGRDGGKNFSGTGHRDGTEAKICCSFFYI